MKENDFLRTGSEEVRMNTVNNLEMSIKTSMDIPKSVKGTASALSLFYDMANEEETGFQLVNGINDSIAGIQEKMEDISELVDANNRPLPGYEKAIQNWKSHIQSIVDKYQATIEPINISIKLVRDNILTKANK